MRKIKHFIAFVLFTSCMLLSLQLTWTQLRDFTINGLNFLESEFRSTKKYLSLTDPGNITALLDAGKGMESFMLSLLDKNQNDCHVHTSLCLWRSIQKINDDIPSKLASYKVAMDEYHYNISLSILEAFIDTMEANNLTYFLYGGSLIGSLRHHGVIPWDDDLDVIANKSERSKIWNALKKLEPEFIVHQPKRQKFLKLYSKYSHTTSINYGWKWPFLDIWLFKENDTHIHDWSCSWCKGRFKKTSVFPLKKRPFAHLSTYAPREPADFVKTAGYHLDRCVSRTWNHKAEQGTKFPKQDINCDIFTQFYPYVERRTLKSNTTLEYLIYNGSAVTLFVST